MKRIPFFLFALLFATELSYSQNNQSHTVTDPDTAQVHTSVQQSINGPREGTALMSHDTPLQHVSDSAKSSLYQVKVTVTEVKNRTLECNVRNHKVIIDQPREFGADDLGPTPPEMLAIAYGSCLVSTMQFLAYQKKITISDIVVNIEGLIDFGKAMGLSTTNRAGFQELVVTLSFTTNMTLKEKETFISQVLEVGAAIDNIANSTPVKCKILE